MPPPHIMRSLTSQVVSISEKSSSVGSVLEDAAESVVKVGDKAGG